ncbi:hypothetical protein MG293_009134 [Ovis ammon polii]|uniref:Uncharacterized protein n=1 Tax=Ovis ammon polii TaxID=230172 RepID=A0AAD4U460_OVIAM|nr:hypothetical protein MG293_009134 [Ovis ammon polii]
MDPPNAGQVSPERWICTPGEPPPSTTPESRADPAPLSGTLQVRRGFSPLQPLLVLVSNFFLPSQEGRTSVVCLSELVDFAVILECAEIVTWGLVQKSLTGARTRASELSWGTISGHSHAGEGMVLRMKWSVKVPKRPSPVQQPP